MHKARFYVPILVTLMAAGCARQQQQQAYIINPSTGRAVPVVMQQQPAPPQYAQVSYPAPQAASSDDRGLFNSRQSAPQAYAQQPQYARPGAPPPAAQPAPSGERGLFTSQQDGPPAYLLQPATPSYATQYPAPQYAAPRTGGPYVPVPNGGFAAASLY
jgi:hypothetical protein